MHLVLIVISGIILFVSVPVICQLREERLHRSLVFFPGFICAPFSTIDQEMGTEMNKGHAQ